MLMEKKISQKRKIVYLVIIAIMIVATFYVIYAYFLKDTFVAPIDPDEINVQTEDGNVSVQTANVEFEKIEFADSFLKKAPYINLKPAPGSTVSPTASGRLNPFIQIQINNSTSTKP